MNVIWYKSVWTEQGEEFHRISPSAGANMASGEGAHFEPDFFKMYTSQDQIPFGDVVEDQNWINFQGDCQAADVILAYGRDGLYPGDIASVWQIIQD